MELFQYRSVALMDKKRIDLGVVIGNRCVERHRDSVVPGDDFQRMPGNRIPASSFESVFNDYRIRAVVRMGRLRLPSPRNKSK